MSNNFLNSAKIQFEYYKSLGEKTFSQLDDNQLFIKLDVESNSIATIVKHLSGNMLSRWTDFLTTDGEKTWRQRDSEFDNDIISRKEMLEKWNIGWNVFFIAIDSLKEIDLSKKIYIRNESHTVTEAINRQLAHYSYHVGQIVFIGKLLLNEKWKTLSIAKGQSLEFNKNKIL